MKDVLISKLTAAEAEVAVLGTMLSYETAVAETSTILKGEMFYDVRHQCIYAAIIAADVKGNPVDIVSVGEELKLAGTLEKAGNYGYLAKVANYTGGVGRAGFYARIVAQKYVQRELVRFGQRTVGTAQDDKLDVADAISKVSAELDAVNEMMMGSAKIKSLAEVLGRSVAGVMERERARKNGKMFGVPTGLSELDRILSGLQAGQLVILAGRPGSGKTSVMLAMVKAAARAGIPACVFSLEMTDVSLGDRLMLSEAGIAARDYRAGRLQEGDYSELTRAQSVLASLPVYIDDQSGMNMQQIRGVVRMMAKKEQCGVVFIDYLQLIDTDGDKRYNREQEVGKVTRQAKLLAKEIGVPVVLLSQLNRDCEKRADKKPELSDLRDSGAIEQDADVVLLVYRPEYYGLKTMDGETIKNVGKLIVAKQRDGEVGGVKFSYANGLTKIKDFEEKSPF